MAVEADFIEPFDDEIPPLVVAVAHRDHRRGPVFQGFQRGVLAHDWRTKHRVLVDLHHRFDDRLRRASIT